MKIILFILTLIIFKTELNAQIGYGTNSPNPNSVLHLYSQDSAKGLVIPVASTAKLPVASTLFSGMIVYNVTESCLQYCNGVKWECVDSLGPVIDSMHFLNDTLYLYENDKILKTKISSILDTNLIDSLTLIKSDTLYTVLSDSLLKDGAFIDSLVFKIKDSIDTDIDSVKVVGDTLFLHEDEKVLFADLSLIGKVMSNGNLVAYGPNDVSAWNASTGSWINPSFSGVADSVVSSNGNFVAYGSNDVSAWNATTGTWINPSFSGACSGVVGENGNFVAYGPNDVSAYNSATHSWVNPSFSGVCDSVVISNGNFVAYGPNDISAWNASTGVWVNPSFSGVATGVTPD